MPRGQRRAAAGGKTNRSARAGRIAKGGRRGRTQASVSNGRLAEIVSRYVGDLVDAVRQEVRRSVAAEVQEVLTGRSAAPSARGRRANGKKRVVQCIAPNCPNPSKGPRFHYLCENHKSAKKSDYEAWRKQRKEKQAA